MIDDLTLAAGDRERIEQQLLAAFSKKSELERLARRLGIELGHIAQGPLRDDVSGLLNEVARLGRGRALLQMARRANPTHPGLNELLARLMPRMFKAHQVAELVRLLREVVLPWSVLERQFLLSVPSTWTETLADDLQEDERVEELVDVLADFPDRGARGQVAPLFEFVLRLHNSPEAGGVAKRLMQWLERTASLLGKDPEGIKVRGYQLFGELYLMVKIERVSVEGFRVAAWLSSHQNRYSRSIFQEDRSWTLEEIPQALQQIWRRRELSEPLKQLGERKLTIEFLLPRELLLHAVEDWQIIPGAPIGVRYQVVVRSLERVYAEVKPPLEPELECLPFALAPWNDKWRLFSTSPQPPSRPVWVRQDADHQSDGFLADLAEPEVVCLALTMTPPALSETTLRDLIRHCLVNGMPLALWVRKSECAHGEVQTLFDGLLTNLTQLPSAVREARLEGFRSGQTGHLGRHLTLVWDDPNRLPTDARPGSDLSAPVHVGVTG
ncbi:hypothetical protein F0U61_31265 [Archangium violaceum]|uniref:VMAP-C domain-containing protein n=1 Tax=Archangium violaceum TaxID=83451 RepID=UPI002B31D1D0|nr:hypothetical protein F0U61_31265 [Archangium violaceum]